LLLVISDSVADLGAIDWGGLEGCLRALILRTSPSWCFDSSWRVAWGRHARRVRGRVRVAGEAANVGLLL
jgi:hypothetical protein